MLVIAKEVGFYGNKIREAGEKFLIEAEEELGSWMELVEGELKGKPKKAADKKADAAKDADKAPKADDKSAAKDAPPAPKAEDKAAPVEQADDEESVM